MKLHEELKEQVRKVIALVSGNDLLVELLVALEVTEQQVAELKDRLSYKSVANRLTARVTELEAERDARLGLWRGSVTTASRAAEIEAYASRLTKQEYDKVCAERDQYYKALGEACNENGSLTAERDALKAEVADYRKLSARYYMSEYIYARISGEGDNK